MAQVTPLFAGETMAAKLLDLKPKEFRELVNQGHLPRGCQIAPGVTRWSTEDLRRIANGDAAEGTGSVPW